MACGMDCRGEGLLTVPEAARRLGVSRTTAYGLMDEGKLPYVKLGAARRVEPAGSARPPANPRSDLPRPAAAPRTPGRPDV